MNNKKEKRPAWFRVYLNGANLIQAVTDANVGRAFKATLHHFMEPDWEPEGLNPTAMAVYRDLCRGVEESWRNYETAVEAGRSGAEKRWGTEPETPLSMEDRKREALAKLDAYRAAGR